MEPAAFCASTRLLIVAGKGGVGKTTVTAAVAIMAADAGLSTCIIEVEGRSGLGSLFGRPGPLSYEEVVLRHGGGPGGAADVVARTMDPEAALIEYLEDHGLRRLSKRLASTGAIDVAATAAPGIKDILVLGKVKQLERSGSFDLLLLDAPAAGHALTFLTSARGLLDAVQVGPIRAQAEDVLELLGDPARCQVLLVTLAEETPVNEVVETAFALEDRVGVSLAAVVVNGLYEPLDLVEDVAAAAAEAGVTLAPSRLKALAAAARFRRQRQSLQTEQVERLRAALPLAQLPLPYVFADDVGLPEVELLSARLAESLRALP